MIIGHPSKDPTPGEYKVIFWVFFILLFGFGLIAIFFGLRVPEENEELGNQLIRYGCASLGIAFIIGIGYWLLRKLL